ncbi:MAG: cytochrome ubiquinol oxidase subunit I [Anaerolineae bacterium]|jgi:cytochrome d ubiquinol oxidase subunit I|nr:cytochrome ubiquinol oxidase subunit I [Anaerolineae bacterium]MBT3713556.1 cytochrome ubiquinol oxidase subunit I [Anaerolineae bacterium]MBT4309029.1 cytochrome ubiquinol oxidase subunit I [Anaerolineae bacterium]MBT4458916.1 cytochrome ubiquinol oxidase subunit I [Anaerolineae bacterium]MBT4841699.1 cytochrome ubiquinol oxidase subunit I [Anaerolineae bacterium]
MNPLSLARWQFAVVTIYHFFYVPLTLGLAIFIAIIETKYVRTGDEMYKKMAKFWGKIFLINFAIGVVTGIVQEFQFGMNWSEYSRFMGDIFGAPLAIEALLAFYMESTFIGLWVFGWDKLTKKQHLAAAWMVAIGSNLSALWILIANSFMQNPVGYTIDPETGRVLMSDFAALVFNPNVMIQFPHVLTSGVALAGFVVMAFSAWHLLRKHEVTFFLRSFRMAAFYALVGSVLVGTIGHFQGQYLVEQQPMKMAVSEAHWNTEDPASLSLFTIGNWEQTEDVFSIRIPALLSFMTYNRPYGEIKGINELQEEFEQTYGPGDYVPPVALNYWSFRTMIGAGGAMILLAFLGVLWSKDGKFDGKKELYLKAMVYAAALPYLAVSTGWILTETGRWPWIVYGLQKIEDAVSPNVPAWNVAFSLAIMTVIYTIFTIVAYKLAIKYGTGEIEVSH